MLLLLMTERDLHAAISKKRKKERKRKKAHVERQRAPALMWLPLAAVNAGALDAFQLIRAETKLGLNLKRRPRAL